MRILGISRPGGRRRLSRSASQRRFSSMVNWRLHREKKVYYYSVFIGSCGKKLALCMNVLADVFDYRRRVTRESGGGYDKARENMSENVEARRISISRSLRKSRRCKEIPLNFKMRRDHSEFQVAICAASSPCIDDTVEFLYLSLQYQVSMFFSLILYVSRQV